MLCTHCATPRRLLLLVLLVTAASCDVHPVYAQAASGVQATDSARKVGDEPEVDHAAGPFRDDVLVLARILGVDRVDALDSLRGDALHVGQQRCSLFISENEFRHGTRIYR